MDRLHWSPKSNCLCSYSVLCFFGFCASKETKGDPWQMPERGPSRIQGEKYISLNPWLIKLGHCLIINFVTWNCMKSVSLRVYISFLHTNNPAGTTFIFFCTYNKRERARDVYTVFHFPKSEWDMAPVPRGQNWWELNAIWCFRCFQFKELEDRTKAWKTASTQRAEVAAGRHFSQVAAGEQVSMSTQATI